MNITREGLGKKMAEIIDLEFYRKFRIVLPVRPRRLAKQKFYEDSPRATRTYRRRRRPELEIKIKKEE